MTDVCISSRAHDLDHARETRLHRSALRGDVAAVAELVRYLEPTLLKSAHVVLRQYRPCGRRSEVEDLVQGVREVLFADEWRVLKAWDPQRKVLLRTYVGKIAYCRMVSALRSKSVAREYLATHEMLGKVAFTRDPERSTEARGLLSILANALSQQLTGLAQEVMRMTFFEEANTEEVARELNLTPQAVRSHKKRIRKMAGEILKDFETAPTGMLTP